MRIVGRLFVSAILLAILAPLGVAQVSAQQSSRTVPADNIVRDATGRIDYMVDLYPETPGAYANQLAQPSRFPAFHKPQVVNAVTDFESFYGIQAHSIISWTGAGFTAFMDEATASRVRADARVSNMEPNRYATYSIQAVSDPGAVWSDDLTTYAPRKESWGKVAVNPPTTASNQSATVYLVDGGAGVHQDLNIVAWINPAIGGHQCDTRAPQSQTCNATNLNADLVGCYTHATGTAGVIGGKGAGSGTFGINPNVRIISVVGQTTTEPVSGPCLPLGTGATGDTISDALDWVAQDIVARSLPNTSVVNLSMNVTPTPVRMLNAIKKLIIFDPAHNEVGHGAFVAQSAGNFYMSACNYVYNDGSGLTSTNDGAMIVGAINNHGQPVIPYVANDAGQPSVIGFWKNAATFGYAEGSNYGSCVDTWAPGDGIYTPLSNPTTLFGQVASPGTPYATYGMGSGTSFAAPHVAGLASLVIEQQSGLTTPGAVEQFIHDNYSRSLGSTDHDGTAITMPSTLVLPGTLHRTYGELAIDTGTVALPNKSVNGYPFAYNTHGYDGELPHTTFTALYGMSVDFHVTGGADCVVTRTSGSTTKPIGGASNFLAPATQAWNEGMGGISSTWTVTSTCFPQGAQLTSSTPNPALTFSDPGTLYPTQTQAHVTLTARNNGYQTNGQSKIVFSFDAGSASSITVQAISGGTNWNCTASTLTCLHPSVLANNATDDIVLTLNVGATPPDHTRLTATFSQGGLVTPVSNFRDIPITPPDLQASLITTGHFFQGQPNAAYIARVSNLGPGPTISGSPIAVTITVPAGMSNISLPGCTPQPLQNGAAPFTCSIGSLNSGAHSDFNLTAAIGIDATSLTTTMNISGGGDVTPPNNNASDTQLVTAEPNLYVQMLGPASVTQGQQGVAYTIKVANVGHANTSGNVTIVYPVPSGLTRTNISAGTWNCSASTATQVSCTQTAVLAPNPDPNHGYPDIVVTVKVDPNATATSVTNTATISQTEAGGDVTGGNNYAGVTTTIVQVPNLKVTLSHGAFTQGQNGTWTATVRNTGSLPTSGTVTLREFLPVDINIVSMVGGAGATWSCPPSTASCTTNTALQINTDYTVAINVHVQPNATPGSNGVTVAGGGEYLTTDDSASDLPAISPLVLGSTPNLAVWTDINSNAYIGNVSTTTFNSAHFTVTVQFQSEGMVFSAPPACTLTQVGQLSSLAVYDCQSGTLTPGLIKTFPITCSNGNGNNLGTLSASLVTPTTPADGTSSDNSTTVSIGCETAGS